MTRRLLAACVVTGAIAVLVALSAGSGRPPAAEPACIAIACVCAALVAHLLHASARALEEGRLDWMAAGVTVALAGMVAKGLGLPGLFGPHAPVTQQPDALAARYLVWHAGLLCAAVLALAGVAPRWRAVTAYAVFWGALLVWTCVSTEPFGALVSATGATYEVAFHLALGAIAAALLAVAAAWWWRMSLSWAEQCVVAGLLLAAGGVIAVLFADGPHAAAWWAELTLRAAQFAVPAVGLLIGFIAVADRVQAFQRELSGHLAADRLRAGRERRLWGSDAARRARRRRQIDRLIVGEGLAVALQPIVELQTRQVVGAEALARFTGSGGARIPTEGCFLDAMALGLGPALELAVVRRALTVGHRLPEGLYLALNVSPQVLESPELEEILAEAGDRPLVVELTEHQAVEDYASLSYALDRLRARGVRVAIDDVGSGFASFRHVTRVQPDILKLDRTMVAGIDDDPVRQSLAAAIVTFARDVGATVVSEGIESQDELTCLKDLDIRCGQGFYLSRPQLGSVDSLVPEPVPA